MAGICSWLSVVCRIHSTTETRSKTLYDSRPGFVPGTSDRGQVLYCIHPTTRSTTEFEQVCRPEPRNVDIRLPGKGNSNSHGARPVCQNHFDDEVDSDQWVVNKALSLCHSVKVGGEPPYADCNCMYREPTIASRVCAGNVRSRPSLVPYATNNNWILTCIPPGKGWGGAAVPGLELCVPGT